ncbi:MerR family DNA-binding protein [Futiania mangrovi]|uniref:MerR family DNA-binding protein n=1 Tax=Futiania mangrovi TaxID=2959716 RepID=A0A9J6PF30_9PROT|nr:MerR family DNA-binding protein [Futiania mangrovii]MCP1337313.1 MerR family DNA-binding protein [Futiania mangrovii]
MNIGEAAQASGLPAKTIRYYEDIGLVRPMREANGYRRFGRGDVARLVLLRRARALGFSVEECRELLSLYEDEQRHAGEVRAIARERLAAVDSRIAELKALRRQLAHLVEACSGGAGSRCAILEELSHD